jgi:para-aminobenzoate synthetase component 1
MAVTDPFVLFRDDLAGRDTVFRAPREIIVADDETSFFAAFERMEAARSGGKWLAGYFSYEAGYLLEPKLVRLLPSRRRAPLVCLGVFDAPVEDAVPPRNAATPNGPIFDARAAWSFEDYEKRFSRLHQHIRQGDCYQGNLTFPVQAQWSGDPLAAFDALTERQPVKYGALVTLGDPIVLSRSPELFFEINAAGMIETHPMKGTAPRGATKTEDERQ